MTAVDDAAGDEGPGQHHATASASPVTSSSGSSCIEQHRHLELVLIVVGDLAHVVRPFRAVERDVLDLHLAGSRRLEPRPAHARADAEHQRHMHEGRQQQPLGRSSSGLSPAPDSSAPRG